MSSMLRAFVGAGILLGTWLRAADLPPELPLWEKPPVGTPTQTNVQEQVRSLKPHAGSLSGLNRVFSVVSLPTYSIHRSEKPNGVGLVICPGGGFRDIWIDREGHDLAIWLEGHGITSLVLKYRTRPEDLGAPNAWPDYQRAVRADGWEAIRLLRRRATELGLQPNRIGICGFSAGGYLAISCALYPETKPTELDVSGRPDFTVLIYPGIPDGIDQLIEARISPDSTSPGICPMFMVNARVDSLTPVDKCLEFYSRLLQVGVNAELHVFAKGSHGFDLGTGRGESLALWPMSFDAWLRDCGMVEDLEPQSESTEAKGPQVNE